MADDRRRADSKKGVRGLARIESDFLRILPGHRQCLRSRDILRSAKRDQHPGGPGLHFDFGDPGRLLAFIAIDRARSRKEGLYFHRRRGDLRGAIVTPWLIHLINATLSEWLGGRLPIIPAGAAGAIAYAFGEGIGRLACISFGCCYGENIERLSPRLRRVFESISFTFVGATRKAVYEGGVEGARVVATQAITACVMTLIALIGSYLFLNARYVAALITVATATQLWRFISETLRADMRGKAKKITAYQVMALVMIIYVVGVAAFSTVEAPPAANIAAGLRSLWDPAVLLFCQALWLAIFLHTGRSTVTGATLSFFVHKERV